MKIPLNRVVELSMQFMDGAQHSPMLYVVLKGEINTLVNRRASRRMRRLNIFAGHALEALPEHDLLCPEGALCTAHCAIDAAIMCAFLQPWEFGSYHEAEERDFEIMCRSVRSSRNFRSIVYGSEA